MKAVNRDKRPLRKLLNILTIVVLVITMLGIQSSSIKAVGPEPTYLSSMLPGDIIKLADRDFYIISHGTEGTKVMQVQPEYDHFDQGTKNEFNTISANNIGYGLNVTYYASLPSELKSMMVVNPTWNVGDERDESSLKVNANVGLLTKSEMDRMLSTYGGKVPPVLHGEWLITPYAHTTNRSWMVTADTKITASDYSNSKLMMRPVIVIKSDFIIGYEDTSLKYLKDMLPGDTVKLDGEMFYVVSHGPQGTKVVDSEKDARAFDVSNSNTYTIDNSNSVGYYLNNGYYDTLTANIKSLMVENPRWNVGNELNEAGSTMTANVGLLTRSELEALLVPFGGKVPVTPVAEWSITPHSVNADRVWYFDTPTGTILAARTNSAYYARAALILQSYSIMGADGSVNYNSSPPIEPPITETPPPIVPPTSEGTDSTISADLAKGEFNVKHDTLGNFSTVTLTEENQTITLPITNLQVIDARGTQEGWSLYVSAEPFTNGTEQMPEGSLVLGDYTMLGTTAVPSTLTSNKLDGSSLKLAQAEINTGMGVTDFSFGNNAFIALTVNSITAKKGNYTSKVTFNLVSGPTY